MLKRKLRSNVDHLLTAKRKAAEARLDILFSDDVPRPTNVQECIKYIRELVDWRQFCEKIPPIVIQSQLYSILVDHTQIDNEINALRCQGHVVIIKLDAGYYGIVNKKEYLNTVKRQIEELDLEKETGDGFIAFCTEGELDVELSGKQLLQNLTEPQINTLVRSGYLTSEVTGMFYLSIPNASLFLRTFNDGLKSLKSIIKRSKFKEILLTELLKKEGKKTKKLGNIYYSLHLIGAEVVKIVGTTSGPLLRYVEED